MDLRTPQIEKPITGKDKSSQKLEFSESKSWTKLEPAQAGREPFSLSDKKANLLNMQSWDSVQEFFMSEELEN